MSAHRPPRSRWLAPRRLGAGGAVLLTGVLGTALLLQNGGGACAAPPSSAKHSGKATFYDLAGGQGNCSASPPADDLYVALGPDEYSGAAACGSYLDVTGPKGKVRVKVFDKCPECETGHLDLSRTAFKKIADEVDGIVPVTYRTVPNPAVPGGMSFTFKEGSSQFWWAVLVDNHANAIASVQAKGPGGSFTRASRADYNFWLIDAGLGSGPFQIKLTDVYGNTATATGIALKPQRRQTTSVSFTGGGSSTVATVESPKRKVTSKPAPARSSAPASSSASPSTSPTVSPSASPSAEKKSPATEAPQQDLALAAGAPAASC
ncbi:expansin EXLX1 family cellulose-binding protein [Actinoplanes sp. N902-109]|uniref:expansin EXLX1 family cellulose-binding protein n=1 Tax=Actinoplanes sp. (strain N902-109) TaxID=649831 RepID=UPI0003293F07|nr:expansin EXLX1 family cellulose-binding protein [Actinoplanes sp. N902-109]AGL15755.1 rare lipoprotein a [Actinoplanes sp. N902-109]